MDLEPKYYYPWSQIKQNQPTKQDINKKYKQIADQFINSQHPDLKRSINKQIQDYTTESNDNTKVNNVQHRQYNQHLKQRTIAGAKSNALWEKEHPTLSTLGYTAAAAPFVVASAPALIPAGDALAGSTIGKGISSILTNPYFNTAMTASGGADAANKIYHGQYGKSPIQDTFTAMESIPLITAAPKIVNGISSIGKPLLNFTSQFYKPVIPNKTSSYNPSEVPQTSIFPWKDAVKLNNNQRLLDQTYINAVNSGNIQEAQRLRDLHFKQSAPNTLMRGTYYRHDSNPDFTVYDKNLFGRYGERMGKGIYLLDDKQAVKNYGNNIKSLYVNSVNMAEDIPGPKLFGKDNLINKFINSKIKILNTSANNVKNADAIHGIDTSWGKPLNEWVIKNSNQVKLADPVTYDDDGNIIPLSKRDNWLNPDIRYGLIPIGMLLGLHNYKNK